MQGTKNGNQQNPFREEPRANRRRQPQRFKYLHWLDQRCKASYIPKTGQVTEQRHRLTTVNMVTVIIASGLELLSPHPILCFDALTSSCQHLHFQISPRLPPLT